MSDSQPKIRVLSSGRRVVENRPDVLPNSEGEATGGAASGGGGVAKAPSRNERFRAAIRTLLGRD